MAIFPTSLFSDVTFWMSLSLAFIPDSTVYTEGLLLETSKVKGRGPVALAERKLRGSLCLASPWWALSFQEKRSCQRRESHVTLYDLSTLLCTQETPVNMGLKVREQMGSLKYPSNQS
jgi:hypothetical protein